MDIKQFVDQLDRPAFNALFEAVTARKTEERWRSTPLPTLNEPEKVLIKGGCLVAAVKNYRVRVQGLIGYSPSLCEAKSLCDDFAWQVDARRGRPMGSRSDCLDCLGSPQQSAPLYKKEKED